MCAFKKHLKRKETNVFILYKTIKSLTTHGVRSYIAKMCPLVKRSPIHLF